MHIERIIDRAAVLGILRFMREADLPLRYQTPPQWATDVLEKPLELLNDHAHLEKKAATNALELLNRWPEPNPPENWVAAMTAVIAVVSRRSVAAVAAVAVCRAAVAVAAVRQAAAVVRAVRARRLAAGSTRWTTPSRSKAKYHSPK